MKRNYNLCAGNPAEVLRRRAGTRQNPALCALPLLCRVKHLVPVIAWITVRIIGWIIVASAAVTRANALSLPSWFTPAFLWSGSYHGDDSLSNRADARFRLNFKEVSPWLDFTVRTQFLDERPADNMLSSGLSFLGAGLYHNPTGSRILYGPLDVGGLPARLRNIYRHGAPFVSAHSPFTAELKTSLGAASAASAASFAARLVTPPLFSWGWQASAAFTIERTNNEGAHNGETNKRNGFLIGVNTATDKRLQASAEFYYQEAALPEQKVTGWFVDKPPLPERDTRIYAGTARFVSPLVNAAADIAYSETFAFGRGMYGNLGLQFGNRPWRFSVAMDTVTPRFVDSAGSSPGQGFRIGGKLERFLPRGELWRVETTLRGYGDNEDAFTRSSSELYYHFPTPKNKKPVSLSQIALSATRNAVNNTKILDSWHFNIGVIVGKLRAKTSCTVDEYTHDDTTSPFPDRECVYVIYNWRIDEEVVVPLDILTLTASLGYLKKLDAATARWKDAEIPFSLSVQFHKIPGRFTVKLSTPGFPRDWKLGLSWRFS
jgi:hypothetical protein